MGFTIAYFLGIFFVGLFYYISYGKGIEIIYPVLLALFVYFIFILYRFIAYSEFNKKSDKLVDNMDYDIKAYTCEEKEFVKHIAAIHKKYIEKINYIKFNNSKNKRFISQWIHNMKTPISVIDLIIQKTSKSEIPAEKALIDIKKENDSLLNKLEQVLMLMRLENFTNDYIPETVDLVKTLRKVINNRKNQFIYSNVYPKLETFEEHVMVLSDEKWNEAMIDQIVSNAVKYSNAKDNSKNVYFTIKKADDKVLLSIKDEGIGIPEYDIQRIFEPFFTGDNGRLCSGATGIGLYFCAEVAKKLGNKINVYSKTGEGTEIVITYLSKL